MSAKTAQINEKTGEIEIIDKLKKDLEKRQLGKLLGLNRNKNLEKYE